MRPDLSQEWGRTAGLSACRQEVRPDRERRHQAYFRHQGQERLTLARSQLDMGECVTVGKDFFGNRNRV